MDKTKVNSNLGGLSDLRRIDAAHNNRPACTSLERICVFFDCLALRVPGQESGQRLWMFVDRFRRGEADLGESVSLGTQR